MHMLFLCCESENLFQTSAPGFPGGPMGPYKHITHLVNTIRPIAPRPSTVIVLGTFWSIDSLSPTILCSKNEHKLIPVKFVKFKVHIDG